jgi:hypothetical protein
MEANLEEVKQAINYRLECLPEHVEVRGNASASGDDAWDKEIEDKILSALDQGNLWAWCCVKVTAEYRGLEGTDYLGSCSYESEEQFRECGGYFESMKEQAAEQLLDLIGGLQLESAEAKKLRDAMHFAIYWIPRNGTEAMHKLTDALGHPRQRAFPPTFLQKENERLREAVTSFVGVVDTLGVGLGEPLDNALCGLRSALPTCTQCGRDPKGPVDSAGRCSECVEGD